MRDPPPTLRTLLAAMARQARDLRLQQTASSLTLLTLLAIVPMAALGVLGLSALPAFQPMRAQLERFLAEQLFLPAFSGAVAQYVNEFVTAAQRLSAVGTVLFLATALMALLTVDRTLNRIWRTPRPRPLPYRLALYWAVLTLGPVLLGGALVLQGRVTDRLAGADGLVELSAAWLPSLVVVVVLTGLYRLAPNERVRWRDALAGAVGAALLLEGLKRLLGLYLATFNSYTVVYGAFAALPLFLSWLFAVWLAVLLGALLAANLPHRGTLPEAGRMAVPAVAFDRFVRVLQELVRAAPAPVPAARLRSLFDGDARRADEVAGTLSRLGYLVRVWPVSARGQPAGVWDEHWLPTPELPTLTLRPLHERLWFGARPPAGPAAGRIDPGGDLLSRPLAALLAPPADPVRT